MRSRFDADRAENPPVAMKPGPTAPKPSLALLLLKWPAVVALVAFGVSELLTDSVPLLQWVWFVPRPLLTGAAFVWVLLALLMVRACGPRRPEARGLRMVLALAVPCLIASLLQMWGLPKSRPADSLRIVHWNASYPLDEDIGVEVIDALLDLDADIVVLTDPGQLATGNWALRCIAAGYQLYRPGRFAVLSRFPVPEATPIAATRRGSSSRVVVTTPSGPLSIRTIDLPSDPNLPRGQTANELAAVIEAVDGASPAPDILVGDFNTPGRSHSLGVFGSGYADAFATAGTGWGGTYPADYPFWRIDLMLVRAPWEPLRAEAVDLNGKRHRAQVVDLARRSER